MTRYFGFALAMLLVACGGKDTVASKSAAAYRDAQVKATPVPGGHEHGGEEAASTDAAAPAPVDHAAHGTTPDAHAGHDMSAHDMSTIDQPAHATDPTAHATDHGDHGPAPAHAAHGGAAADHSAMGHAAQATDAHADHTQQSSSPATMDHSAHAHHTMTAAAPPAPALPTAPRSSAEIRNADPSATLQQDAFDAPSPVSASEAAKAQQTQSHERHQ